jgi:hypothetical protein
VRQEKQPQEEEEAKESEDKRRKEGGLVEIENKEVRYSLLLLSPYHISFLIINSNCGLNGNGDTNAVCLK